MSHAILNPSGAHRWAYCLGSTDGVIEEIGLEAELDSEFADEGTAAHEVGAWALSERKLCSSYIGRQIDVHWNDGRVRRSFTVDDDMASYVQVYVDAVNDRVHDGAILLVEQKVDTGIVSQKYGKIDGTADAIIIDPVHKIISGDDLKYGRGKQVWAHENDQLRLYGLGVLNALVALAPVLGIDISDLNDWKVRMAIHQPRLDHYDEEILTVPELLNYREWIEAQVAIIDAGNAPRTPSESACQWCPLKATCPALMNYVDDAVLNEFADVSDLTPFGFGAAMDKLPLVEQWVKAIREGAYDALERGEEVPGWCLKPGRKGPRQWTEPSEVEAIFKNTFRLTRDEMYDSKLISPTQAEKLLKGNPQRWENMQQWIKQSDGRPTLARAESTDQRVQSVAEGFKIPS